MDAWLELVLTHHRDRFERMSTPSKNTNNNNKSESDNILIDESSRHNSIQIPAFTFTSIQEALTSITQGKERDFPIAPNRESTAELPNSIKNADHIQVLCTGSLHLIGGALQLLEPDLNNRL